MILLSLCLALHSHTSQQPSLTSCDIGKQDLIPSHWASVGTREHRRSCAAFI